MRWELHRPILRLTNGADLDEPPIVAGAYPKRALGVVAEKSVILMTHPNPLSCEVDVGINLTVLQFRIHGGRTGDCRWPRRA